MIDTFKFWCYKVLPLVYDDSLSYYEVLCKCVKYINALIDEDRGIIEDIEALKAQIETIQQWIDDFDTDVAERIIREALANVTSVMFTSLILPEEDPDVVINRAFTNGCKTVCVDEDIHVPQTLYDEDGHVIGDDHRINVPSGCTVRGMGGVVTFESGSGFRVDGERETPLTQITTENYTTEEVFTVQNASDIVVGKRYKITGTQNLFGRDDEYTLGAGTEHVGLVYAGFECTVTNVSGNTVTINRAAPYFVGSPAYINEIHDAENVVFENLKINSYDHAIWMKFVNNCEITNCNITNETTYPVYMSSAYNCRITNNNITELTEQSFQNNSIVINSGGENLISGCTLIGGFQAVDITFGQGPYYTYDNMVANNVVMGQNSSTGDSLNTHPAAINTVFIGNSCGGNVRVRGKYIKVISNNIAGHVLVAGRAVDGTAIVGNVLGSLQPVRISYQYAATTPYDGPETIIVANNTCTRCSQLIDGTVLGNTLKFFISGNTAICSSPNLAAGTILSISTGTSDVPEYAAVHIVNNTFLGFNGMNVFGADGGSVADNNFTFLCNNHVGAFTYNIGSGTINGARSINNTAPFTDTLTSFRRNNIGITVSGTEVGKPTAPLKGDTFISGNGTYQIYDGTGWKTITTTT